MSVVARRLFHPVRKRLRLRTPETVDALPNSNFEEDCDVGADYSVQSDRLSVGLCPNRN
jgi:hypothetical protein